MTQAIITAQDTKAAQDLARRRGELVPELVKAMEEMILYFEPMARREWMRTGYLHSAQSKSISGAKKLVAQAKGLK